MNEKEQIQNHDPATQGLGPLGTRGSGGAPATFPFLLPPVEADEIGRLASYRVLHLLGMGGMGMVFHAEDIALRRPVALKVMRPDMGDGSPLAAKRFLQEARALASLHHEHLVTVYQVGQEGDTLYLAMELLQGETLERWVRAASEIDVADILRIGKEIATGLAVIHEQGLIHRDIKPPNIMIEPLSRGPSTATGKGLALLPDTEPRGLGYRVKILDFGLARTTKEDTHFTQTGIIVGTPAYLSPEQARGKQADARSDLFSLGCVLYWMCTRRPPFQAENTLSQLASLVADDPTPIQELNPRIPRLLSNLIMDLLNKNPDARPESAALVVTLLEKVERSLASREMPTEKTEVAPRRKGEKAALRKPSFWETNRKMILVMAGSTLALIVLVASATFVAAPLFFPKKGPPDIAGDDAIPAKNRVFLSDFQRKTAVNWPFADFKDDKSKKGPKGDKGKGPPRPDDPVSVQGRVSPHGIHMHPTPPPPPEKPGGEPTSLSFELDGKFRSFHAGVSLNDSSPLAKSPMTFAVYGDGNLLWQSQDIWNQKQAEKVDIDVTSVKALKLEVTARDDIGGCHAVWIEPFLAK